MEKVNDTGMPLNYSQSMRDDIREGLSELNTNGVNWLSAYQAWSDKSPKRFDSLLKIKNSFNPELAGDSFVFDFANPSHMTDLDIIQMSVFLSQQLRKYESRVVHIVRNERNKYKKLGVIENYFKIVDSIVESHKLAGCIVILHGLAEQQMVLKGKPSVDLYASYFTLREMLRKGSVESLYLLFTYWRITRKKKKLKSFVDATVDYIQTYYDEFDKDPDMHLYYPLDGLMIMQKVNIIVHWLELIAFHTDGIFEKYKSLNWLRPVDTLADQIIETNQISKFEMLQYRIIFPDDDDEEVIEKATWNHGYAVWIKTADIMLMFCDLLRILYSYNDSNLNKLNVSRAQTLELYDNMVKIRNLYMSKIFFYQVYYLDKRKYADSQVMEALESDAEEFSKSIDDVLQFVEAVSGDDVEGLLQAKQKYLTRIKSFSTEEQESQLDELTDKVVEHIKELIQKRTVYDELYSAVSGQFSSYATILITYPNIMSSLVSAEYLFQQYVEGKVTNEKFDYSCISIMYYMSLEDFVNRLVYMPFARDVLSLIDKQTINDKIWQKSDSTKYVSSVNTFWPFPNRKLKDSCEIGVLGHLLEKIDKESELSGYLSDRYTKIDFSRIKNFGSKLIKVAPRRNEAAHGGNYLTYLDVVTDKDNVYNVTDQYRGMILELLEILFGK